MSFHFLKAIASLDNYYLNHGVQQYENEVLNGYTPDVRDTLFMKSEQEKSPFIRPDEKKLIKTALSAVSALASLAGPHGKAAAGGISFVCTFFGINDEQAKDVVDVEDVLKTVQLDKDLNQLQSSLKGFIEQVSLNSDRLVSIDEYRKQLAAPISKPSDDLYTNEAKWMEGFVKFLRKQTIPGAPDRLASCTGVFDSLDKNAYWSRPDVRLAILHANTYLFLSYKFLIICYTREAAGLWIRNGGQPSQGYREAIAACYNALKELKKVIANKRKEQTDKLNATIKWRKEQVSQLKLTEDWGKGSWDDDKLFITASMHDGYTDKWGKWNVNPEHKDEAGNIWGRYNTYLDYHIERVVAAERLIIASWSKVEEEVENLIKVPAPTQPPIITTETHCRVDTGSVNPILLSSAYYVSYRYRVKTIMGLSDYSPWTEKFEVIPDQPRMSLPAIHINCKHNGFHKLVHTAGAIAFTIERRVYPPSGVQESVAAELNVENVANEIIWIDVTK